MDGGSGGIKVIHRGIFIIQDTPGCSPRINLKYARSSARKVAGFNRSKPSEIQIYYGLLSIAP